MNQAANELKEPKYCAFSQVGDDGLRITYRCRLCGSSHFVLGDKAPKQKVCLIQDVPPQEDAATS
jgi:hypothetical protein